MDGKRSKLDIFLAHRAALIDYATPIVRCRSRAEDIVQEAYIRFDPPEAVAADGGREISWPVSYLYRIVRNLSLDWRRTARTQGVTLPPDAVDQVQVEERSPERTTLYRDQLRIVDTALAELPERTRTAFALHRIDGCTLQEVADRLGISVGLVHKLVREAMTHCAERLQQPRRR